MNDFYALCYLTASVFFILGLKGLSSPATARRGNYFAIAGMAIAVIVAIMYVLENHGPDNLAWILGGLLIGAGIGLPLAWRIKMTDMPQLVAILHSFVGLSAVLVDVGHYLGAESPGHVLAIEVFIGAFIGAITFTGSVVAFSKLQGLVGSAPVIFKGQHMLNLAAAVVMLACGIIFAATGTLAFLYAAITIALILGVTLIIPIGGADMPVIVSMLNSYSGWAAAATGFTLGNSLLIVTGALVGSSGAILSYIMCKAMNRSFISVVLGGFGTGEEGAAASGSGEGKTAKSAAVEDAAYMMKNAGKVIIVPGYGMAVAQAQHAVKEIFNTLEGAGVECLFAIHPVAGRMPGHMNVLLAEADVPYDKVLELEDINNEFGTADVALVIGANDIINPAAEHDTSSPIYGMPILKCHKSRLIYVIKRSMRSGYAGVENELYFAGNCMMLFGDAKAVCEKISHELKNC